MNRRKLFGLMAITIVVAAIGSVAAIGGKFPRIDPQSTNNITNAIKANDFNAWKEAMTVQLTVDNFNKLVKRYQTMSHRHGNMSEKQGRTFSGSHAVNAGMIQALKDGNYDAWKTASVNSTSPLVSKITNQDEFKMLVQLYQAKQAGNNTQVMALSKQLGLRVGNGKHRMHGHFGR